MEPQSKRGTVNKPGYIGKVFLALMALVGIGGMLAFAGLKPTTNQPVEYPDWWFERDVILQIGSGTDYPNDYAQADDYAVINQGQLKFIATQAASEMDAKLPGGAGSAITAMVGGWTTPSVTTDDYAAANLGQLKAVAKPFYDRLIAEGVVAEYPWTSGATDDDDFAAANLGQLKMVFSWDLEDLVAAVPEAPSGLVAIEQQDGSVVFTWNDNSENEQGFGIEVTYDGGATWQQLGTVGANTTTLTAEAGTVTNMGGAEFVAYAENQGQSSRTASSELPEQYDAYNGSGVYSAIWQGRGAGAGKSKSFAFEQFVSSGTVRRFYLKSTEVETYSSSVSSTYTYSFESDISSSTYTSSLNDIRNGSYTRVREYVQDPLTLDYTLGSDNSGTVTRTKRINGSSSSTPFPGAPTENEAWDNTVTTVETLNPDGTITSEVNTTGDLDGYNGQPTQGLEITESETITPYSENISATSRTYNTERFSRTSSGSDNYSDEMVTLNRSYNSTASGPSNTWVTEVTTLSNEYTTEMLIADTELELEDYSSDPFGGSGSLGAERLLSADEVYFSLSESEYKIEVERTYQEIIVVWEEVVYDSEGVEVSRTPRSWTKPENSYVTESPVFSATMGEQFGSLAIVNRKSLDVVITATSVGTWNNTQYVPRPKNTRDDYYAILNPNRDNDEERTTEGAQDNDNNTIDYTKENDIVGITVSVGPSHLLPDSGSITISIPSSIRAFAADGSKLNGGDLTLDLSDADGEKLEQLVIQGHVTFYVEGKDTLTNAAVISASISNGERSADDAVTLLPVDLEIAISQSTPDVFVPGEDEGLEGGYIPINADNDNGSDFIMEQGRSTGFPTTRDFDAGHTPDEDDLVKLAVSLPSNLPSCQARLRIETINDARGEIRIWEDREKQTLFALDQYQSVGAMPDELWIEGTKEGRVRREITLIQDIKVGTTKMEGDRLKLTVTPVVLDFKVLTHNEIPDTLEVDGFIRSGKDNDIEIVGTLMKRNLGGNAVLLQRVGLFPPGNTTAAARYNPPITNTSVPIDQWHFNYSPPNEARFMIDSNPGVASSYPKYPTVGTPVNQNDLLVIPFYDNPGISPEILFPEGFDGVARIKHQFLFLSYLSWEFSDGSIYVLAKTNWSVKWHGDYSKLTNGEYQWIPAATAGNFGNDQFARENAEIGSGFELPLPEAKVAGSKYRKIP